MNKYLEFLAIQAGLHTSTSGDDGDGGWESLSAEKDGRPLPTLAVAWSSDDNCWHAMIGVSYFDDSATFAHPSDAFRWLRNAVSAYEFTVCPHCNDTGVVEFSRDCATAEGGHYTVDGSEFCDHCWHGSLAAAKEAMARC